MKKINKLQYLFATIILLQAGSLKGQTFNPNDTGVMFRQILDTVLTYQEVIQDSSEGVELVKAKAFEAFWSASD